MGEIETGFSRHLQWPRSRLLSQAILEHLKNWMFGDQKCWHFVLLTNSDVGLKRKRMRATARISKTRMVKITEVADRSRTTAETMRLATWQTSKTQHMTETNISFTRMRIGWHYRGIGDLPNARPLLLRVADDFTPLQCARNCESVVKNSGSHSEGYESEERFVHIRHNIRWLSFGGRGWAINLLCRRKEEKEDDNYNEEHVEHRIDGEYKLNRCDEE